MIGTADDSSPCDKTLAKRTRTVLKVPSRRVARTCHDPACNKNPYFGWHGQKALYCVTHKEPEMVDVKNKRCEAEGCMKRGLFGYDGERARFCGGHRLEGMVDLKNKRCKWVGCAKQANFAAEGKSTACFCGEHKSPGMVDVKGRRCEVQHCTKVAGFGLLGHQPSACALHRGPGMVDMKQRARLTNGKVDGINVKIGEAMSGGEGGPTSYTSKWGKRYRKSVLGLSSGGFGRAGSDGPAPAVALGLDSRTDILRPLRRESVPSLQHWYSESGLVPSWSGPSCDQSTRPRGLSGSLDAGTRRGVLGLGVWTYGNQTDVSCSSRSGGGGGGVGGKHTPAQWPQSRGGGGDTGSFSMSYPGATGSGMLPGISVRGSRFAGSGAYGITNGGTHSGVGMEGKTGADGWRLCGGTGGHALGDGSQQTSTPTILPSVGQHGYGVLPGLASEVTSTHMSDGQGRGGFSSGGCSGGADSSHGGSMVKSEHVNNSDIITPDVESEDIWLRDLMQGAMPRENGGSSQHPSGAMDVSSSSTMESMGPCLSGGGSRSVATTSSGSHYPRHLGLAPPSMGHTLGGRVGNNIQREDRRPFHHQVQQRQQQPQQPRYHCQANGGNSPKASRLQRVPYADAPPMVVRSPSTGSNGATPPHDSATIDAIPRGLLGNHDGVGGGVSNSTGGGGGVSGIGDGGLSRAGARGAAPPSLNHLFMSLPSLSGCDMHTGGGFNPDVQFLPAPRVSSPGWGGV